MKKSIIPIVFIFVLIMLVPSKVEAMRPYEIVNRRECEKIELATAKEDGSLEKVDCFDDYGSAKNRMYELTNNDNLVIIENGMIIDAKYGVVDYNQDFTYANTKYVKIYDDKILWNNIGYIRTASNRADDAVILDFDYDTKRIKIKVAGIVGWIDKYDNTAILYDVIPLAWAKTPQSYTVTSDKLIHYFPDNAYGSGNNHGLTIDVKPEMLNQGTYYSYDGHYFYTDMKTLINDYKAGNYNNSVNSNNPYYNYYQYLSFRTKSNYNMDNINNYLNNIRLKGNTSSKMYNTGEYFYWVQEHYGVNAVLMMAIGINESGSGTSDIAQNKNNLFGLNAVDATPGQSSDYFASVKECIETYGYRWMSYWYLQPGDSHFRGANLGDKGEGLNVKYASDPFWGEKAAHYYYEIDSNYGFQDRNSYLLAVLDNGTVYPKKSINGTQIASYYKYNIKGSSVVIIEQLKDSNGVLWYKIQNDPNLDSNLDYIGDSMSNPRVEYNWNGYTYVEASNFRIISNPDSYNPNDVTNVDSNNTPIKTVSSVIKSANYKYSNGMVSGISIGTIVDSIINNLKTQGATSVTVTDVNGTPKSGSILATGDKLTITLDGTTEVINVVVSGDTDGDGSMSAMDYVNIKNHIMETHMLSGVYLQAADVDNDNSISAVDYVSIKNYIMSH